MAYKRRQPNKAQLRAYFVEYMKESTPDDRRIELINEIINAIKQKKKVQLLLDTKFNINGKSVTALGILVSVEYLEENSPLAVVLNGFISGLLNGQLDNTRLFNSLKLNVELDSDHNTLLHLAAISNNLGLVRMLINLKANANIKNRYNEIPLQQATVSGVESLLLKVTGGLAQDLVEEAQTKSELKRNYKKIIIKNGSIREYQKNIEYALHAFEQAIFIEDKTLVEPIQKYLENIYSDPIFKSIIIFLALASRGELGQNVPYKNQIAQILELQAQLNNKDLDSDQREVIQDYIISNTPKIKKYKILAIDAVTMKQLNINSSDSYGYYSNKETAFIATKDKKITKIIAIMMHESMHYILEKLFNNNGKPYTISSRENEDILSNQIITFINSFYPKSDNDRIAFSRLSPIKLYSAKNQVTDEIFVRFLEIMIYLGPKQGANWLEENLPELYDYFVNTIFTRLNETMQLYMASSSLSEALDNNKELISNDKETIADLDVLLKMPISEKFAELPQEIQAQSLIKPNGNVIESKSVTLAAATQQFGLFNSKDNQRVQQSEDNSYKWWPCNIL